MIPSMHPNVLQINKVEWWKTVAKSLDLNPFENLWHELNEYIRREVKPETKEEWIEGIKKFWATIAWKTCTRYLKNVNCICNNLVSNFSLESLILYVHSTL